jgi:hypothetical protein
MKSHWVEHKGRRVFIAEYSHFGNDSASLQKEADETIETLLKEPPNSVLSISNVEWTTASISNTKVLMDILPFTNNIVRKRCVIGATGISWKLIEIFNQWTGKAQFRAFQALEEALDWIVQDEV